MKFKILFYAIAALVFSKILPQNNFDWESIRIGRLRYYSGGDWYSNPSSLPNLMSYFGKVTNTKVIRKELIVSLKDDSFKQVPLIYFTGHGKFSLNQEERKNLAWFLLNGGFLFADDNFGMNIYIHKELNQLFPGSRLIELPLKHPIFKKPFSFPKGLPKIHKHHGGPPIAYGLYLEDKMVAFYGYNTDLGDGWEDIDIHNNGQEKHEQALKMGVNVIHYALNAGL